MGIHIGNKPKSLPHTIHTGQTEVDLEPECAEQNFKTSDGECRRIAFHYNEEREGFLREDRKCTNHNNMFNKSDYTSI